MNVGVVNQETWSFFYEIYADLQQHYSTSLFQWQAKSYPFFNDRINTLSVNRKMREFLHANNVVFFEWASEFLDVASHLPKRCGIVTRLHRYEMYGRAEQINWDAVDKIILVSQAKKREFLSRFPEQAAKIELVFEAVDTEKYVFHHKPFRGDIGILCHLTPRKRVYELVLAFRELIKTAPGFHLHIGGDPQPEYMDYYAALREVVRALGLEQRVTFYGPVSEPAKWYKNIDIFISNSYSEGLQVAPMEAMSSGCYCLSHHWDGAEELLPEPYLYYTDWELLEKILAYRDASEHEKQLEKQHMRAIVCEKFDIHRTKTQIRSVIASVA